jgi:DMSO/TMAO reductase YedYZ molybdopterin-dependent catalytic subunit
MWTRRKLLKGWIGITLGSFISSIFSIWKPIPSSWAKAKELLSRGFPKNQMINMNPAEIDNRDLEIDPLDQFGTMGPTDISVDVKTYRLKISGKVAQPLSLAYDQILNYPSVTEIVLLICPGFFANNGRWTGVHLRALLQNARIKIEAKYVDIKGSQGKVVRISREEIYRKKIFLAYRVNDKPLPQRHGYPLRFVFEDAYGSDWVKFVNEIVIS